MVKFKAMGSPQRTYMYDPHGPELNGRGGWEGVIRVEGNKGGEIGQL